MPSAARRVAVLALLAVTVWFGFVVVWAVQPQDDAVPVGVDYSKPPPQAPRLVSQSVECNSLFDTPARDPSPLPGLTPQPKGSPALDYQREPCVQVQRDARVVFGIDVLAFLVVAGAAIALLLRRRAAQAVVQTSA